MSSVLPVIRTLIKLVVVFLVLFVAHASVLSSVYPFGGREQHAIHAYSAGPRYHIALQAWGWYVLSLGGMGALLNALRYPLPWIVISGMAAWMGGELWLGVANHPFVTPRAHYVMLGLDGALQAAVFGLAWLGHRFAISDCRPGR